MDAGIALAAFVATPVIAQELTGTLKKIKESGTITTATATRRFRSRITMTSRTSSATRWTSA